MCSFIDSRNSTTSGADRLPLNRCIRSHTRVPCMIAPLPQSFGNTGEIVASALDSHRSPPVWMSDEDCQSARPWPDKKAVAQAAQGTLQRRRQSLNLRISGSRPFTALLLYSQVSVMRREELLMVA